MWILRWILFLGIALRLSAIEILGRCSEKLSGIYLQRNVGRGNNEITYSLLAVSPRGGILQVDSSAKQNGTVSYSDASGFYDCLKFRRSRIRRISFTGFLFVQTAQNITITVAESSINCRRAFDLCTDNAIECSKGRTRATSFPLALPNAETGNLENPIPNTLIDRQFIARRIHAHPILRFASQRRCYDAISGVYIYRYEDGTYHVVAYARTGYSYSIGSDQQLPDGTFVYGTSLGTWKCTDQSSVSGQYNYFTYANATRNQTIIAAAFYEQHNKRPYADGHGLTSEVPFPLQYQSIPFRNGQLNKATTTKYTFRRLFKAPILKACHTRFAGAYVLKFILSTGEIYHATNLYANALVFNTLASLSTPRSNGFGFWDCDSNGTLSIKRVAIRTLDGRPNSANIFSYIITEVTCDKQGNECTGTSWTYRTATSELPVNGSFPSAVLSSNSTVAMRKLKPVTRTASS